MPYSESWHRVADLRVALLPSVEVHKQVNRGKTWYVLQEPGTGRFFRLQPEAYRFACALSSEETVSEVWYRTMAEYPESAPDQKEVVQLLTQLHHANLLFFKTPGDHDALLTRFQQQRGRERLGQLMAILYLRVPLWNPNRFLDRTRDWLAPLFSKYMLWLLAILVLFFAKIVVENWDRLWTTTQGVLAPGNLPLLYLSIFVLKLFHEMGHAIVCKRYGGEVHSMGLMFIVFTPLPYIDASTSWSMRSRWERAYVGAAGMIVELFFASLAAWVWLYTGPGLINSIAFNLMLAGSVSAFIFNGNPLLRFDAYYILADLVETPNLYQKASQQWLYFGDRYLFGTEQAESPGESADERFWLSTYGVLSLCYRLFVMVAIGFMVADIWLGLGLLMVIMMAFIWVLIPGGKLFGYLLASPKLMNNRLRAWGVTLGVSAVLVSLIGYLPLPYVSKAPGVVLAKETQQVYTQTPARLIEVHVRDGQALVPGDLIAVFDSADLRQELTLNNEQLREARGLYRQSLVVPSLDPSVFQQQIAVLTERKQALERRLSELEIHSESAGVWQGGALSDRLGTHVPAGELLGTVVDTSSFKFVAVVNQSVASELFNRPPEQVAIRLWSQNKEPMLSTDLRLIPFQKERLPSQALAISADGPVMTRITESGEEVAMESFFELRANLNPADGIQLAHGMTGLLRLETNLMPLGAQLAQRVRQELQRRYGL